MGVCAVHLRGMIPVQASPAYSSPLSTAKPVRTFAEASTSGTERTIVPFNSCSLGGRTVAQRPRITYSTKSSIAASLAGSPSPGLADERFIENAVDQFAVVAATIGLAPNPGSFRWGEVGHTARLKRDAHAGQVPIWFVTALGPACVMHAEECRRIDLPLKLCTLKSVAAHLTLGTTTEDFHGSRETNLYT